MNELQAGREYVFEVKARVLEPVDVVVAGGGGTVGVMAALSAAQPGAKMMLVEMSGQLGGIMTTGRVSFPGYFHALLKQQGAVIPEQPVHTRRLS